jgi:hypothetical protein
MVSEYKYRYNKGEKGVAKVNHDVSSVHLKKNMIKGTEGMEFLQWGCMIRTVLEVC